MTSRRFDSTVPDTGKRGAARRTDVAKPEPKHAAQHDATARIPPAMAAAPGPRAQAAALNQASGGRLARAGSLLLQLQRQYGNRHVQQVVDHARRLGPAGPAPMIQAKLTLGPPGDRHEREADRVARRVAGEAPVQASLAWGVQHARPAEQQLDPGAAQAIRQARSGGRTIPEAVREPLERALGADLSAVRLHTDTRADQLNRTLRARAFTTGQDIFFRRGEYSPGPGSAHHLLAHELAHVVQQNPSLAGHAAQPLQDGGPLVSATGQDGLIQRALPLAPHPGDRHEINRIAPLPPGDINKHQGVTSRPVHFVAPKFRIQTNKSMGTWVATVELTRQADIGTCEATYRQKGTEDSGFRWGVGAGYAGQDAFNRLLLPHETSAADVEHVIFNISASVARGSKAAEQEHLDDYHYAYGLTLQAAEQAIESVAGHPFSAKTKKAAIAAARSALLARVEWRSNHNLTTLNSTDWGNVYRQLCDRTGTHRDAQYYHTQGVRESAYWNTPLAKKLSEAKWGFPVHHVDVWPDPGRGFLLGVLAQTVIDPHAGQANPAPPPLRDPESEAESSG